MVKGKAALCSGGNKEAGRGWHTGNHRHVHGPDDKLRPGEGKGGALTPQQALAASHVSSLPADTPLVPPASLQDTPESPRVCLRCATIGSPAGTPQGLLTAFLAALLTSLASLPTLQPERSLPHANQLWMLLCSMPSNELPRNQG